MTTGSSPILSFESLSKSWFGVPAVEDLTLDVREGSVLGLIGLVFGVAAGAVVASIGLKRALYIALFGGAAMAAIGAIAHNGTLFLATRLAEGFSHLLIVVAAPALMTAHSSPKDTPFVLAIWGCFFGFGFGIISLVAPEIVALGGWRTLLGTHAILGEYKNPAAVRKNITGVLKTAGSAYWNIQKN